MAVSDSFDFTLNRDALITKALLMLGVISAGQTPTSNEISSASESLNLMLKAWQADGLQLWQVRKTSVTPVQGRQWYTMGGSSAQVDVGGKPMEIVEIYRRDTSETTDVPMTRMSREEFWKLGDKDSEGTPTNYYFDPQLDAANLYIWPTADSTFASDYTLEVFYSKAFDDMDSSTDTLSFPQEWELAVVYGLAVILAPEYGLPIADRQVLIQEAMMEKDRVMHWDTEHGSIFLTPEPRFSA